MVNRLRLRLRPCSDTEMERELGRSCASISRRVEQTFSAG